MKAHYLKAALLPIVLLLSMVSFSQTKGTGTALEVGDTLPKQHFENVVNNGGQPLTFPNGKAKLIVLDFWATWCGACIKAFPNLIDLQQKFKADLQVVLITNQDKALITKFFKTRKEVMKEDLKFPSVYSDTSLKKFFPHSFIPHTVVLDQNGKVLAITHAGDLTEPKLKQLMTGKSVDLAVKKDRVRKAIDMEKPFFMEELVKPLYVHEGQIEGHRFRSIITPYIPDMPLRTGWRLGRTFQIDGSISGLYGAAYEFDYREDGKTDGLFRVNKLETNVKNKEQIIWENGKKWEENAPERTFCYDIVFLDVFKGAITTQDEKTLHFRKLGAEVMKKDLDSFFNYKSEIVRKPWDIITMRCTDTSKVISPQAVEKTQIIPGYLGIAIKNEKIRSLKRMLTLLIQKNYVMDLCNYEGKVNFEFKGDLRDQSVLFNELAKFGIRLQYEKMETNVLVISDR